MRIAGLTFGTTRRALPALACLRAACVLDFFALLVLGAFVYRYNVGYIPRFLVVWIPVAAALLGLSIAGMLMQRSAAGILNFLLPAGLAGASLFLGLSLAAIIPPVPTAMYKHRIKAGGELFVHTLPENLDLFLDGFDKSQLRSLDDLGRWASRYAERWAPGLKRQGFSAEEAKAISAMLFTSTLWGFGNTGSPGAPGCITVNEDNRWQFQPPTFEVVRRTRIGCCTDYAHTLSLVLAKNGFENRYVVIPGHILNEAKIDGRWQVLDATTNVFVDAAWKDAVDGPGNFAIHQFPHPGSMTGRLHRSIADDFQDYEINMLLLSDADGAAVVPGRDPDPAYAVPSDRLY